MKEKSDFVQNIPKPTNRFEHCLLGSESVRAEYSYNRHERMYWYSAAWVHENVEIRQAHL